MKNYKIILLLNITPFLISSAVIQNQNLDMIVEKKGNGPIKRAGTFQPSSTMTIADMRIVEGHAGQRAVEVMVTISQPAPNAATATYHTRNGTASAGSDYAAANGTINFARGEIMKKITVSINGDRVVEASETFDIVLGNPSEATLADSLGMVTIVNDDLSGGSLAVYEVRFTFNGFTSFLASSETGTTDCPIRRNGTVELTGLLAGTENVPAGEDIIYSGTLQLDMNIDICSVKPTGGDPEYEPCGITVIGSGPVEAELEMQFDNRGAYLKIQNKSGKFWELLFGSCDGEQIALEYPLIPDKSLATKFNGLDLPIDGKLRVGRYVRNDKVMSEGELVIEVLRAVKP